MPSRANRLAAVLIALTAPLVAGCGGGGAAAREAMLVYTKQRVVLASGGYEERGTLFVARVDGSHARRLTDGIYPDISPDGRWIAFRRSSESSALYVVEADGGRPRHLARDAESYDWAPDSRSLALSTGRALAIVDVESGKRHTIVEGPEITGLSFSPAGDEIAWVRYERLPRPKADLTFREDIYRSAIRGGKPQRLTRTADATGPLWGPEFIAFSRFDDDP